MGPHMSVDIDIKPVTFGGFRHRIGLLYPIRSRGQTFDRRADGGYADNMIEDLSEAGLLQTPAMILEQFRERRRTASMIERKGLFRNREIYAAAGLDDARDLRQPANRVSHMFDHSRSERPSETSPPDNLVQSPGRPDIIDMNDMRGVNETRIIRMAIFRDELVVIRMIDK